MSLLNIYLFLLMIIPAWLVYSPLGGAGAPSSIFALILLVCYIGMWLHPALGAARGPQPVRRMGIIFAFAMIASYVAANRSALPVLEVNAADRALLSTGGWLGVMLLAADGIRSMDRLNKLLRRIVNFAAFLSLLAALQFATGLNLASHVSIPGLATLLGPGSDLATRGIFNRPAATALSPIELAAVLVLSLPFAIHYARFAPPELSRRRWIVVAIICAGLPVTLSRTAFTALAAVCLVIMPTWPKRDRRLGYTAMVVGAIVCYISIPGLLTTFDNLIFNTSNASREGAYSSAAPFIAQHPWLGTGPGTFLPQTYFFTDNQFLNTLISTGVIGLLVLIALFGTGWATARRARKATDDPELRSLGQSLAAAVAATAVSFTTLDALAFPIVAGLTFLIIGCTGALFRLSGAQDLVSVR